MIVNPQLFNYRLIIGSLITAITVLSVLGVSNYNTLKSYENFLEQEKHIIQSELSDMINRYDVLSEDNTVVVKFLEEAKSETQLALKQLQIAESNLESLSVIKNQLFSIRKKNKQLAILVDSLKDLNDVLRTEKLLALNELNVKSKKISALETNSQILNSKIEDESSFSIVKITAKAYKSNLLGKTKETSNARSVKVIDVCLLIAENPFVLKGEKEIYIQIVNPKNNVIADKGSVTFGNSTLIYSDKQVIEYNNKNLDICTIVEASENDKPFIKGLYYINVFHKDQKLGSTTFELN